ncbi:MAG TPA: hypothetical protein VJP88_11300 [Caulobacteraceae bacterium]|nr:hypothetical protein [Caulobacteraceae bacterium]
MGDHDRDELLLATLPRGLRAECEVLVDGFIAARLTVVTREALHQAADRYEETGLRQPSGDGRTGLLFAAILRQRASALTATAESPS